MKKILLVALAILALSFVLFAEKAEKPMMGKDCPDCPKMKDGNAGPGMGMHGDMMKDLNLTKEQKKKFDAMKDEHMKFMNLKKAEMENLHIDKQNAMQAEQYDKAKQLNKSINDLQLVIENAMIDHRAAMAKELTPEQKEKLKEKMPMGMGKGKGMKHDKGMGMGKGPRMEGKGPCAGDCK